MIALVPPVVRDLVAAVRIDERQQHAADLHAVVVDAADLERIRHACTSTELDESDGTIGDSPRGLRSDARRRPPAGRRRQHSRVPARGGAATASIVCFETFGAATNDTRFCVFSATKPIVASAVWLLIGDGLLDASRPVAHYIPEFATNGKEVVTVEQVMLHTSGFPNAPMDAVEGGDTVDTRQALHRVAARMGARTRVRVPRDLRALGARGADRAAAAGTTSATSSSSASARRNGLPRVLGLQPEEQDDIARVRRARARARRFDDPARRPDDASTTPRRAPRACPAAAAIMTAADDGAASTKRCCTTRTACGTRPCCTTPRPTSAARSPTRSCRSPRTARSGSCSRATTACTSSATRMFGKDNSPGSFGHAGAFCQVAWADPATGISFSFLKNGLQADMMADAVKVIPITDAAAALH